MWQWCKGKWFKEIKGFTLKLYQRGLRWYCDRCPRILSATSSVATSHLILVQFCVELQKNGNSWGNSVSDFTRQIRYNCRQNPCSFDSALLFFSFFNTSLNILQKECCAFLKDQIYIDIWFGMDSVWNINNLELLRCLEAFSLHCSKIWAV